MGKQKQKRDKNKQGKLREEGSLAILRKFSAGMRIGGGTKWENSTF